MREYIVSCKELITTDMDHHSKDFQEMPNTFYRHGAFEAVRDDSVGNDNPGINWYADQRFYMTKDPKAWCKYSCTELETGTYEVYAHIPEIQESTTALYTIDGMDGYQEIQIDQRAYSGGWVKLSDGIRLNAQQNNITVKCSGEGYISVGQMKYVQKKGESLSCMAYDRKAMHILGMTPTVLFYKKEGVLYQLLQLTVNCEGIPSDAELVIEMEQYHKRIELKAFLGVRVIEAGIPDITGETSATFKIISGDECLHEMKYELKPTPKYTVYMYETYHNDLGYENSVPYKAQYWADWFDEAIKLIEKHTYPENPKLNYNFWFEHLWQMLLYTKMRSRNQVEKLKKLFEEKRVYTGCQQNSVHFQWGETEQTARVPYYLKQQVKNHLGIDLQGVLVNADNPTVSWDAARMAYEAGYKGILMTPNSFRGPYEYYDVLRRNGMSNVFYWELPDGKRKIPTYIGRAYSSGMNFHYFYDKNEIFSHKIVDQRIKTFVENGKEAYPYDIILDISYYDNERPNTNMYQFIKQHNMNFEYPVILHNASFETYFEDMFEKYGENGLNMIPTYSGELNNFSGDYAVVDVNAYSQKTQAAHLTNSAQILSTMASTADKNVVYPYEEIYRQYWKFNEFDEHCYPTGPEYGDFQFYSTRYYKTQGAKQFMLPRAKKLLNNALAYLSRGEITVYNTLSYERSSIVYLPEAIEKDWMIIDCSTQMPVLSQRMADGKLAIWAENIPALGYKTYKKILVTQKEAVQVKSGDQAAFSGNTLENKFYKITFDPVTKNVISVFDKELERELVKNGEAFNEFLFRTYSHGQKCDFTEYKVHCGQIRSGQNGDLFHSVIINTTEPESGAEIESEVLLWNVHKKIEFVNQLRQVEKMYEPFSSDYFANMDVRYRNNLFYGFGADIENCKAEAAISGGIAMNPYDREQQLWDMAAIKDFIVADNYFRVYNDEISLTLFTEDAPIIMQGDISYNHFSKGAGLNGKSNHYEKEGSRLYSYFQAARIGVNGILSAQEANYCVRYAITSHQAEGAELESRRVSDSISYPLAVVCSDDMCGDYAVSMGGVKLVGDEVFLTTYKQAEEPGKGLVIRLLERYGKECSGILYANMIPFESASLTDISENNDVEVVLNEDGGIPYNLLPNTTCTYRLLGEKCDAVISDFEVSTVNDGKIGLQWKCDKENVGFYIYRSEVPFENLSRYEIVGYTSQCSYMDNGYTPFTRFDQCGFAPGRTFYYCVQPVNACNMCGEASKVLSATLDSKNVTPPNPVRDLMAIQLKQIGGTYRVLLQWEKPADMDISSYNIYRSEMPDVKPVAGNKVTPFPVRGKFPGTYMETFEDHFVLRPDTTYYYKVCPVDTAGNEQTASPEVSVYVIRHGEK